MDQQLLTGIQVARILNVSRSKAFSMMQNGNIPTVRFGKSVRVIPEDLIAFIQKNRSGNSPTSPYEHFRQKESPLRESA